MAAGNPPFGFSDGREELMRVIRLLGQTAQLERFDS
jgi:hypothetical protein